MRAEILVRLLLIVVLIASIASAQMTPPQTSAAARSLPRASVVPQFDRILPDIGDGGGVSTTITILNLDNKPADFQLFFLDPTGNSLPLNIAQANAATATLQGTIPVGGSATYDTTGQGSTYTNGWAVLGSPSNAAIGATVVQHIHAAGVPDTEVALSLASLVETHFRMAFDNRNGASAGLMLIYSDVPAAPQAQVSVTFRDATGKMLTQGSATMSPLQKIISVFANDFPSLAGQTGTVEISTTGRQLAGMGFRINSAGNATSYYDILSTASTGGGPTQPAPVSGPLPGLAATCAAIKDTVVYANDQTFLGRISADQFAADSMANPFGSSGSAYAPTSIFDPYGPYGGQYSTLSPFNPFTTTPPVIFANSQPVAYLTVNQSLSPRVDTGLMLTCIGRN